ncbi:MAG: TlpA family protein disulfide reductase [Acidobacteria bacterium]|nr:TlpA family protein disulfide reductase [Acidobacteriota bacterium]
MPTITAGKKAPPFELKHLDGSDYSLERALSRGPVLAAFFKVSCPTCQYTFPFVERLYRQFRPQAVQIIAVSQDNEIDTRRFAREYGVTFPTLIDDYPYEISRDYGVKYVPTLFLIAPAGHVELMSDGFCKVDLLEIQKLLAKHHSVNPPGLFQPGDSVPEFKPG